MTMTIGRASINEDPYGGSFQVSGDQVSFTSSIVGADVNECKARMQQLAGLVNNQDEDVVPFTWTEDPSFDGFYRIQSIELSPVSVYLSTGECPFSITMRRVGGWAIPQFETVAAGALRTNAHAYTALNTYSLVTAWYSAASSEGDYAGTAFPFNGEDGAMKYAKQRPPVTTIGILGSQLPANYYKGSARIEISYDSGTTWYPLIGDQIPSAVGRFWRISNSLYRMSPSGSTGISFSVESYTSGAWSANTGGGTNTYKIVQFAGAVVDFASMNPTTTARVIRNSPECVTVRTHNAGDSGATFDWTLRRGAWWIEVSIVNVGNYAAQQWGINSSGGGGVTGYTGGIRQTASDAAGRRWLLGCTSAVTTSSSTIYLTGAATSAQFCVTSDYIPGTFSDTDTVGFFIAYCAERQKIVPR